MQQTLTIIKPDAVTRHLTGKILSRIEDEGFRILGLRMLRLTKEQAEKFYQVHAARPFFQSLTTFMSSGPVVVALLERDHAIETLRKLMGATDPQKADAGTIRKIYGLDVEKNSIHGSDSPETATTEITFFFNQLERCSSSS
jgi:nucleoside-diphosphate kinase